MKTEPAKSVKRVLTTRNAYRNPLIRLSADLAKIYLDDDGNPYFKGKFLAEMSEPTKDTIPDVHAKSSPFKQSTSMMVTPPPPKSLTTIIKDAVIEKFNATTWLDTFENKCIRLGIPEHQNWIVIRLFLEESATDWYQANRTRFLKPRYGLHGESYF